MNKNKMFLTDLNPKEYEHNLDRKTLEALRKTPGLTFVGKALTKYMVEKITTIQCTGSNIKITESNYPDIYEYIRYACEILDLRKIPELYLQWGYDINACTIGSDNPIVIINSGLIDLCSEDEILFIIGHECGHIKSNHMLYHMMARFANSAIDKIPFGDIAAAPIKLALYHWDRMSEFTADRAGLLCCQNPEAAVSAFVKMAGLPIKTYGSLSTEAFIKQARDFKLFDDEMMNKLMKYISIAGDNHPWTVMRASELLKWVDTGIYGKIVGQN